MRYRLLASYQGAPYEAGVGPGDTGVVLFAACPPPEDLCFEPATGHWRKEVNRDDVHALYESRPVGMFRGERCVVLDEISDRLHIAYLGHDAFRAEQLGYWEVDRGVFELITPRQEVTEIVEQRLPVAALGEGVTYPANGSSPRLPSPDVLAGPELLTQGHASMPTANERPLPLEAQAMRAARKAKKGQSETSAGHSEPAAGRSEPAAGRSEPAAGRSEPAAGRSEPAAGRSEPAAGRSEPAAGLSEPSSVLPAGTDGPGPVPSWSPQVVLPQAGSGQPSSVQTPGQHPAQAANHSVASEEPAGLAGSVISGGFVAGVSPAVASPAGGHNQPAGAEAPAGPFIGSAPVPHPGPQLPGAGGQVNGTHHGDQANAPVLRPVPGLPRDQFERPVSAMAASAAPAAGSPVSATSPAAGGPVPGYASTRTASMAEGTGAPAGAGVGLAVADPAQGMPYAPAVTAAHPGEPAAEPYSQPAGSGESQPESRRRRASRRRLPTQRIFSELAAQAGIPSGAYAINDDVDGAMCLVRSGESFEVFNSLAGARHEVRVFQDEESAYFYLFGLLAADAVRTGALGPTP